MTFDYLITAIEEKFPETLGVKISKLTFTRVNGEDLLRIVYNNGNVFKAKGRIKDKGYLAYACQD